MYVRSDNHISIMLTQTISFASVQQLDRRMEQLSRWPFMWLRTHKCSQNDAFSNASFMCFWSSISQCVVDVLRYRSCPLSVRAQFIETLRCSGIVVGLFLRTYSSVILMQLHQVLILHTHTHTRHILLCVLSSYC